MPHPRIRISYDGPALADHQMEVRDLAPALLAFGDLMERSAHLVYGEGVRMRVNVRGSFRTGSFGVELIPDFISWWQAARDVLTSETATALTNLAQILGFASGSLWGVVKVIGWLRGRRTTGTKILDDGTILLEVEDGEGIAISREAYNLLQDPKVRKHIEQLISEPLSREGIDEFLVADATENPDEPEPVHYVDKESAHHYRFAQQSKVGETEYEQVLQVVAPSFSRNNKWRVRAGEGNFTVYILDEQFLDRVENGVERFGAGDLLRVRMRSDQYLSGDKLTAEHSVLQVIEHQEMRTSDGLPFDGSDGEDDGDS